MTIDRGNLREILRLFPIYQLRMIIKEREVGITSNDPEELIDGLLEDDWDENEFEKIVERLQTIQEEGRPIGYYVLTIDDAAPISVLEQNLLENEAEFDDDGHIEEDGYELHESNENTLQATRWRIDTDREFNFRTGEVETEEKVKPVEFRVDLDEMRIYIDTNQYGKARSVTKKLRSSGFEFGEIGHKNLSADEANNRVKQFVDALEEKVE